MKKLLCIVLVLTLILNIGSTAFAVTNNSGLSVTKLSGNSLLMTSGDQRGILTFNETAKGTTLTVKDIASGEVEGYFYLNKVDGTIYSSYTGNTVSVSEFNSNDEIMPMAVGDVVATTTNKISYAKLSEMVTPTSSEISIAAALLATVAFMMGVTTVAGLTLIVTWLGTPVWDVVRQGITNQSTDHGIKVVVNTVEIERSGDKGYRYEVASVSTY